MRSGGLLLRVRPVLIRARARAATGLAVMLAASAVLVPPAGIPPPSPGVRAPVPESRSAIRALAAEPRPEPGGTPLAALPPPPGTTTLVSARRAGDGSGDGISRQPSISANGRYVAFSSIASDLVRGDTNDAFDVFVLDRRTGKLQRAPVPGASAVPRGGEATEPSISADGRIVAFTYLPVGSLAVVTTRSVVAWDRSTGAVEIVSLKRGGATAAGRQPSVSANGRYVAYTSDDPEIRRENENPACELACPELDDVFRFDRQTRRTVLLSVGPGGGPINGNATDPAISGDGGRVAFLSNGGASVAGTVAGAGQQVYVRDVADASTRLVTKPATDRRADGEASDPAISGNGRFVAYQSAATNLVAGAGAGSPGLFRTDLRSGRTIMVSLTPGDAAADGVSGLASVNTDGSMIAFASTATNLVPAAGAVGGGAPVATTGATARLAAIIRPTGRSEVYIRNLATGETVLVSVSTSGGPGGATSVTPAVSGTGRFVAFASTSATLVRTDRNGKDDVFLRDLPPAPVLVPDAVDLGARAVGVESAPGAATLSNAGWSSLSVSAASITGGARKDFRIVADGCRKKVLRRGEACTVSVTFKPASKGTRAAVLEIADDFTGSPRTARLVGRASQAKLELDPPLGPPGIVTEAVGTDFPPGSQVRLTWSAGITGSTAPVVADETGAFRVPVLVFHNDVIGTRDLVAEPYSGTDFPPVEAEMVVTTPSSMPPGFGATFRFVDLPLVLVMRG